MAKKAGPPLINIDLGNNGGRLVAKTLDDAEEWIQHERMYWEWMSTITPRVNELQQLWKDWSTVWMQLSRAITQIKSQEGQPHYKEQIEGLGPSISEPYTSRMIIHSNTPEAKFIEGLIESEGGLTAISSLAYLLNRPFPLSLHETQAGTLEAFLFDKGIRSRSASEKKALEQLRTKWQEDLYNLTHDHETLISETEVLKQRLKKISSDHDKQFQKQLDDSVEALSKYNLQKQTEISDLFENTKTELNNITATYDEKLGLQAPVTYWSNKRKIHEKQATKMLSNIWVYGLIGVGSILTAGALILGTSDKTHPSQYFFLLVFSGSILWILKILVKIYLSHIHLELDAQERVTLAHSYLAFLRRGKGVEDTDRQIILKSLFRHSSDGLQKDDGGNPHIVLDILERMKGKL